jgi:hypothetical protein
MPRGKVKTVEEQLDTVVGLIEGGFITFETVMKSDVVPDALKKFLGEKRDELKIPLTREAFPEDEMHWERIKLSLVESQERDLYERGRILDKRNLTAKIYWVIEVLQDEFGLTPDDLKDIILVEDPSVRLTKSKEAKYIMISISGIQKIIFVSPLKENLTYVVHAFRSRNLSLPTSKRTLEKMTRLGEATAFSCFKEKKWKQRLALTLNLPERSFMDELEEGCDMHEIEDLGETVVLKDGKKVVALRNYVHGDDCRYGLLQTKVTAGQLQHISGVRGCKQVGPEVRKHIVKLYDKYEVDALIKEYEGRKEMFENGESEIDGRRIITLHGYLTSQGFSNEIIQECVAAILDAGIYPCIGDFAAESKRVISFYHDEVCEFLPTRINRGGGGEMLFKKTIDGARGSMVEIEGEEVIVMRSFAEKNGVDQGRLRRRVNAAGIEPINLTLTSEYERRVINHNGDSIHMVYKKSDIEWLLPQHMNEDGTIDLLLRNGEIKEAYVLGQYIQDRRKRDAVRRLIKAAGIQPVPHVNVKKTGVKDTGHRYCTYLKEDVERFIDQVITL